MQLSPRDVFLLSQCAISAAYQAGQIIVEHTQDQLDVQHKIAGDSVASQVVTAVDLLCQARILQVLGPTCEAYDLALLTEETPDDRQRLDQDFFWCIDPLDGTLPFIESTPGYAVSIALVSRAGHPHLGVVYDPVTSTLYHAIKGQGAYRNGVRWHLPTASSGCELTFIADRSFGQHALFPKVIEAMHSIAQHLGYAQVKRLMQGGAAMNACWVLDNTPACYFKLPKTHVGGGSLWDYAATACLFQEIGAVVSDVAGQPLALNRADTTFMHQEGVLYASDEALAACVKTLCAAVSSHDSVLFVV